MSKATPRRPTKDSNKQTAKSSSLPTGVAQDVLAGLLIQGEQRAQLPATATLLRHLAYLGARTSLSAESPSASDALRISADPQAEQPYSLPLPDELGCILDWAGPVQDGPLDESTVQATCGLMHVHGRRYGSPRPLGGGYASVVAGVVAAQGVLAALLAQARGLPIQQVSTSVAESALLAVSQYLAAATAPEDEEDTPDGHGAEEGPPFFTADGQGFELETLEAEAWIQFWAHLGVQGKAVQRGWRPFVSRYANGVSPLPRELHEATLSHTLADILAAASAAGASVSTLRTLQERVEELGLGEDSSIGPPWQIAALSAPNLPIRPLCRAEGGEKPLAGITVIEAGRRIQGPLAAHVLRMLGARVIRVELPGGDPLRWMPPFAGEISARFLALNKDKDVVEINIKDPAGRERLLELGTDADVFLHNWAPGKAAQLGLDAEDFARRNPYIVYAYASGWGNAVAHPPTGTDFMVQAYAGLSEVFDLDTPRPSLMTVLDVLGALVSAEGVLAGLLAREQTGAGYRVDSSLLSAATVLQTEALEDLMTRQHDHRVDDNIGDEQPDFLRQPFQTSEGLLAVSADRPDFLQHSGIACGFETHQGSPHEEMAIAERLRSRPAADWERDLLTAGISAAVVCDDLALLARDPRFSSVLEFDGCCYVRQPWRFI